MLDRATESQHLALAEHISDAERLLSRLEELVHRSQLKGANVEHGLRAMTVIREVLGTFVAHRNLIARTIDEIDAAKL